ncbi:LacI family DNA-binding transcriptional regulator [Spirosoma jeollabukense]
MTKKTSLKDIAQTVGVSTALVSYVLNNQKENRISKEVARKIRQVAQELNYQPNQIAKSLKTSKTRTLGLIVADIANPFSSSMARIVEDEADKHGYTVIFGSSDENPQKCQKLITTLLNRQVDGLLISAPAGTESQIMTLQQQTVPFVLIDRYFPSLKTSYVALDNYQATHDAVRHLVDAGYQRIGLITFKTALFHINERTRGYQSALQENGLPVPKSRVKVLSGNNPTPEVAKAIQSLRTGQDPVDAIVFTTNVLTFLGLKAIRAWHLNVPNELAVVGFDEADAYELFDTSLTYIRQPIQEMGQLATQILLESLKPNAPITQTNLEATLVIQASTQPLSSSILKG